jgi:hypothetical protein
MELKLALGLCQLFSLIVFGMLGRWYLVPWLTLQNRGTALIALLSPHLFRYIALQAYSAQRAGFPISDSALSRIVYGDVAGAMLAVAAIVALRHASRVAVPMVWVLVVATIVDTVLNISGGIRENLFGAASNVTWLVVGFYVPLLIVSLGLTVWQLYSRRREALVAPAAAKSRVPNRVSLAS